MPSGLVCAQPDATYSNSFKNVAVAERHCHSRCRFGCWPSRLSRSHPFAQTRLSPSLGRFRLPSPEDPLGMPTLLIASPAARSEFERVDMLACKRVLAHLLLRVEGHCHNAAHDAFMALPPYTCTREGEAPHL